MENEDRILLFAFNELYDLLAKTTSIVNYSRSRDDCELKMNFVNEIVEKMNKLIDKMEN